jgi:HEAT repeat protein
MFDPDEITQASVDSLIATLSSPDGLTRQKARIDLVRMGEPAVDALAAVLQSAPGAAHWEAAKALGQIASPRAAPALVDALEDDQFSVRWLAAEALVALGGQGLVPLLRALAGRPTSGLLREGAHHVLHDLIAKRYLLEPLEVAVKPVLATLDGSEPAVTVPLAAERALALIEGR